MTDLANKKIDIETALANRDFVPVMYEKEGVLKAYLLTHLKAPSYEAKTDRIKVATPPHLIQAFDATQQRFVSLKLENIRSF